jgi:hypothetical protein
MQKYVLNSKPYPHELFTDETHYFCKASLPIDTVFEHEFSLQDAGIIPNDYNRHRTFRDELDAAHYLATQRKLPYTVEDWEF